MKIEEQTDRAVSEMELITQNIAVLTSIVNTQNAIIMCLLHNFDVNSSLPTYQTKEDFDKEMTEKIEACKKAMRRIYGHPETDKS